MRDMTAAFSEERVLRHTSQPIQPRALSVARSAGEVATAQSPAPDRPASGLLFTTSWNAGAPFNCFSGRQAMIALRSWMPGSSTIHALKPLPASRAAIRSGVDRYRCPPTRHHDAAARRQSRADASQVST